MSNLMDNPTPADAEQSYYCRVVFKDGKPLLIEKLDPFIPEVIDIGALIDAARKETVLRLSDWAVSHDLTRGSNNRVTFDVDEWNAIREELAQLSHPAPVHKSDKE